MIQTKIEIASLPEQVRAVFLDFSKFPEWSHGFIESIELTGSKTGNIDKGDRLRCVLDGMTVSPVVLENSENEFKWRGSAYGLLSAVHSFHFEPSSTNPGSTTLIHNEEFAGLLAFLFSPDRSWGRKTQLGFEKFNSDLKDRCEQLKV